MEKTDLMEIAKTIKELGYKVAMDGRADAVLVGNDKNAIYINILDNHIAYSLVCKRYFHGINDISNDITKCNIDKALNSDVYKKDYLSDVPVTIEEWLDFINFKFLDDENKPTHETPNKPTEWTPSPEDLIKDNGNQKELPSMACDSIKLPNKEKARDVLIKKLNDAIKEFEDETGVKVTSIHGSVNALEEDSELGDMSWRLTTEL